jgi:hypothetical protein
MADFIIIRTIRGALPREEPTEEQQEKGQLGAPTGEPAELYEPGEEDDYLKLEKPSKDVLHRLAESGSIFYPAKRKPKTRRAA